MTPTATYIAEENCLQEQLPPELEPAIHDANAHPELYDEYKACVATLRKIPCDPSCKGLWEDQQKVVEGKDYEVRPVAYIDGKSDRSKRLTDTAFPLVPVKSEPDMPNLILTAFQNEPVNFLLSNALRHLTQDQQRQLCNALQERLPIPTSIEQEAERLYPDLPKDLGTYTGNILSEAKRSAHITCARQYMGEVEKYKQAADILSALCALKKHKDEVGKDEYYEKAQPEIWKVANKFLEKHNL